MESKKKKWKKNYMFFVHNIKIEKKLQMSLWGATVITNLLSAIPIVGQDLVELIWGGYSVSNATLNRFFSLHFLLPFLLAALVLAHLIAQKGLKLIINLFLNYIICCKHFNLS